MGGIVPRVLPSRQARDVSFGGRACLLVSKGYVRYGQFVTPHDFRLITGRSFEPAGNGRRQSLAMCWAPLAASALSQYDLQFVVCAKIEAWMPLYYFNVINCEGTLLDPEGTE